MKLVQYSTEIKANGNHLKDFGVVFKTKQEQEIFDRVFVELLNEEDPWTQEEIIFSNCEPAELETEIFIESSRGEIAERTADFKRLYKAAKAQSKR